MTNRPEFNGKCECKSCKKPKLELNDVVYRCKDKWFCKNCCKDSSGCEKFVMKFRGKLIDVKARQKAKKRVQNKYKNKEVIATPIGVFVSHPSGGSRRIGG